jgi:hypothetical protein
MDTKVSEEYAASIFRVQGLGSSLKVISIMTKLDYTGR